MLNLTSGVYEPFHEIYIPHLLLFSSLILNTSLFLLKEATVFGQLPIFFIEIPKNLPKNLPKNHGFPIPDSTSEHRYH